MAHIRRTFTQHNAFYAPTYLALEAELRSGQLPYQRLTSGSASSRARAKGKQADRVDEELEKEKRWIIDKAEMDTVARDEQLTEQVQDADDCRIECGCCFSEYSLVSCFPLLFQHILTTIWISAEDDPMSRRSYFL